MDIIGLIISVFILVTVTKADNTDANHHNDHHHRLTLTPSPTEVTRFLNDSYFVSCNLPSPESKVHWRSSDGEIVKHTKGRVHIEQSRAKLLLFLEHIESSDKGNWACEEDNGGHKTSFELVVIKRIRFRDVATMISVKAGDDAEIMCDPTGDPEPKVQWYFNGIQIADADKFKIVADGLNIRRVSEENAGEYTCKAFQINKNVNDVQERTILLKIQHAPKWLSNRNVNESFAYISGTVNLTCETAAEPAANFTWHQGKKHRTVKTNHTVHDSPNLSILQLNVDDSTAFDVYTCKARNRLGSIEKKIHLKEGFKPESPEDIYFKGHNSNILIIDFGSLKPSTKDHKEMPIVGYVIQYVNENEYKKIGFQWDYAEQKYVQYEQNVSYIINELEQNTTYVMRAASRNLAGLSDWTKVRKFNTQSTEPPTNSAYLNHLNFNLYQMISISSILYAILNYFNNNVIMRLNSILQYNRVRSMLVL